MKNILSVSNIVNQRLNVLIILFAFFCASPYLSANIIEIHHDGTGDYPTIQEGIDEATFGDTVWVRPGYYDVALQIDKDLALVSDYEFTGNEADIHNTILDGDYYGWSVIKAIGENDNYIDVYICGFTIQNGEGWDECGGGIFSEYADLIIKKNVIQNNKAKYGGGVSLKRSFALLSGNTVKYNHAFRGGGGINISNSSSVEFNSEILNNMYLNFASIGSDMRKTHTCPNFEVIVDTFTVAEPDFFFLYGKEDQYYDENCISYSIQNAKIELVEHDLYVSSGGDDTNSGLNPNAPLQNIHYALTLIKADSINPRTIFVEDGLYSADLNNQYFPLHMKSYVSLIGESMDNTILDSETGHIYANDILEAEGEFLQRDWSVENFKMINNVNAPSCYVQLNHNVNLKNIEIANGSFCGTVISYRTYINLSNIYIHDYISSTAIFLRSSYNQTMNLSNIRIENLTHLNNNETTSLGIWIDNNHQNMQPEITANIVNAEITDCHSQTVGWPYDASALRVLQSAKVNFINSTITDNYSTSGGAVIVSEDSEFNIYNSIIYGDAPQEVCLDGSGGANTLNVYNSLVEGGEDGIYSIGYNNIYYDDETCLDENPLFINTGDYPFALSELSPCIDAGTTDLPDSITLPEYDLAGNPRIYGDTIDMGAYEWQPVSSEEETISNSQFQISNLSCYPNPFNPETTISFTLEEDTRDAEVKIYNIKGQHVKTLMDAQVSPGEFNIIWCGRDNDNHRVASGSYFVKLNVNGIETSNTKITLLK
jgi:hypothetical protein